MRDPWLFWAGLTLVPFAAICFYQAMHAELPDRELRFDVAARLIASVAGLAMGFECVFRTVPMPPPELQKYTSVGLLLFVGGVIGIGNAVLRAFKR